MAPPPTIVVDAGPSWAQVLVPAIAGVLAILLAAVVGARLGARWTREQSLELHRTQRRQDALLTFLDLLAEVDMAMRRSLPSVDPTVRWSEAVPGVGAKMIREHPGVTWDRSDEPDQEVYQWGNVVGKILDAEEEWRTRLRARVNDADIEARWAAILNSGAPMGLAGSAAHGPHLERLHSDVLDLMRVIRKRA
ncbi:MAG TPA: hypothetical protein VGS09_01775 [Actinomycetota bacterium]|jgi:hypothetical protein|nr:hypothetical protein [Actinomycetota bacterium]